MKICSKDGTAFVRIRRIHSGWLMRCPTCVAKAKAKVRLELARFDKHRSPKGFGRVPK
jgi:hypothetical protein